MEAADWTANEVRDRLIEVALEDGHLTYSEVAYLAVLHGWDAPLSTWRRAISEMLALRRRAGLVVVGRSHLNKMLNEPRSGGKHFVEDDPKKGAQSQRIVDTPESDRVRAEAYLWLGRLDASEFQEALSALAQAGLPEADRLLKDFSIASTILVSVE